MPSAPDQVSASFRCGRGDAAALGVAVGPYRIGRAISAVLGESASSALRITVTRGAGGPGLAANDTSEPTIIADLSPLPAERMFEPVRLAVTDIRRNETSPGSRHKTLSYLDAVMAVQQASAQGAGETLLLSTRDKPACAVAANVFVVAGARLLTPRIAGGALPGVVRAWLLSEAHRLGLSCEQTETGLDDALSVDALFLTNSLRLIAPVPEILGRMRFSRSEVIVRLMERLSQAIATTTGPFPFAPAGTIKNEA